MRSKLKPLSSSSSSSSPRDRNPLRNKAIATALTLTLLQVPLFGSLASAASSASATATATNTATGSASAVDESQAQITKEQAVERIRSLFPGMKDATADRIQFGENNTYPPTKEAVWTIDWSVRSSDGSSSYGFSSTVDAITGDIVQFYYPYTEQLNSSVYYPPKVTKDKAETIAKQFIAKASPSLADVDKLKLVPNNIGRSTNALFGPIHYDFMYELLINGIPTSQSINIMIDGNGNVTSYSGYRSQQKYPSAEAKVTAAQAEEKYKKDVQLELAYIPSSFYAYTGNNKEPYRIGYVQTSSNVGYVDAQTGDYFNEIGSVKSNGLREYTPIEPTGKLFEPHSGQELTEAEATAIVLELANIPESYGTPQVMLNTEYRGLKQKVWTFWWNNYSPTGLGGSINATLDAATGRLIDFSNYDYSSIGTEEVKAEKPASSLTEQQAQAKAMEYIKKLYPDAASKLKLMSSNNVIYGNSNISYSYGFQQFYKDIPIQGQSVSISFDGEGKLVNYSDWTKNEADFVKLLPSTASLLSSEAARLKYVDAISLELRYVSTGGYHVDGAYQDVLTRLAYVPLINKNADTYFVNAVSSSIELLYDWSGTGASGQKGELPADARKHWASEQLATLYEHNVLKADADGLLHPDKQLTTGEWMNLLYAGFYPDNVNYYQYYYNGKKQLFADVDSDSPYASAARFFVQRGWLEASDKKNLNPDKLLTRGELAIWLTKLLNYDQLSEFMVNDTDVNKLKDAASIRNKGAAALVMKLGLLTAADGKFNPNVSVTRADASVIMMRLVYLQGRVDTPIMG